MNDLALRVRTPTEIVDAAFRLYSRNVGQYVLIAAIAYSPVLIATLILRPTEALARASVAQDMSGMLQAMLGFTVTIVMSVIGAALVNGTVTALGSRVYHGDDVDVAAAVKQAVPRVPVLIVAALLLSVLYFLGFLAFLVGFVYVFARFFAVAPVIVLEKRGPFSAFSRSSQLSKGRKWHVLGVLLMVYGIYFLAAIGISIFVAVIDSFVVRTVLDTMVNIALAPVIGLATMVLYYDTRIRSEGYDLERMAADLGMTDSGNADPVAG